MASDIISSQATESGRRSGAARELFGELGFYTLPGNALDSRPILDDPIVAEELGLGSIWIGERFGRKDAGVIAGAAAALSQRLGIATAVLGQLGLRHPLAIAGFASTMMEVSQGRFALGLGRGVDRVADATGTPRITFAYLEHLIDVLRRLWRGERVDHQSAIGTMHGATLGMTLEPPPPVIMGAMGDKTCRWAGRHCDGVVLNSLWSTEAVAHSTRLIREGAEEAGRDPKSVRVWTILITACEVPETTMLETIVRRMNTYMYLPFFTKELCRVNGWDPAKVAQITAELQAVDASNSAAVGTLGDEHTSRDLDVLRRMREIYPDDWIHQANAVGDRHHCAKAVRDRLEAGADGILFHGSTPQDLAPLLKCWPEYRPVNASAQLPNPGLAAAASAFTPRS
ncbi:MAG: TIGR03857 family LLM class F420-dependent oxidoreductase [Terriglobia bacterium]